MSQTERSQTPFFRLQNLVPVLALFVGIILLALLATQVLLVRGVIAQSNVGGALITFSADRGSVFSRSDCVTLTWDAQNIREIAIDQQIVNPSGRDIFCLLNSQTVTLYARTNNGTFVEMPILIRTVVDRVEVWFSLVAALLCMGIGLVALLLGRQPFAHSSRPRLGAGFAWFGGLIVVMTISALILEMILRLYFGAFGTRDQRVSYIYSRDEINAAEADTIPLPGVDFALAPDADGYNELGYRGDEILIPKPEGLYRIIVMGDSSIYGFFVANEDSYPAQLERILRDDYGYDNVEVVNGGAAGYSSFNIAANFATRYLELEPDLAIFNEGANDIRLRERAPDCYRGMNPLRGLNPEPRSSTSYVGTEPISSALLRFAGIRLGLMPDPQELVRLGMASYVDCGDGQEGSSVENIRTNPPVYFERNLVNIVALANAYDIDLMYATWPFDANADDIEPQWEAAAIEQNEVLREVAQRYDVAFLDYAAQAPQESEYWSDYMHMFAEGLRLQAEAFAAFIDEQGFIPRSETLRS